MQKDYCPGYIDLAAGGIVNYDDEDVDTNAKREVEEELGIISQDKPRYLFKFPYQDQSTSSGGWCYVYWFPWLGGGSLKPQESEVDALFYWTEDVIDEKIKLGARITPEGIIAYQKFKAEYWAQLKTDGTKIV
jgi:8-oxo-dGTP pyrophosphatase MutT (NUDIX family)